VTNRLRAGCSRAANDIGPCVRFEPYSPRSAILAPQLPLVSAIESPDQFVTSYDVTPFARRCEHSLEPSAARRVIIHQKLLRNFVGWQYDRRLFMGFIRHRILVNIAPPARTAGSEKRSSCRCKRAKEDDCHKTAIRSHSSSWFIFGQ
jgi:hypothetical protein